MADPTPLPRRVGHAALSLVVAFTVSFLALAYVGNPNTGGLGYLPRSFARRYTEPRFAARAEPLWSQYVDWVGRLLTVDLGTVVTESGTEPAAAVLVESVGVTLLYLVPAAVVAVVAGTGVQLLAVGVERRDLSRAATLLGAVAVATPVFLFAYLIRTYLPVFTFRLVGSVVDLGYNGREHPLAPRNLRALLWPFLTATLYLFAIQLRVAGMDLAQYADEPFVKTARAKGVGVWGICRHVFPHSAARLLTVLTSEMIGVVLVGIYVIEWVTRTPGFGTLTVDAVGSRYPGLIFGVVLLPVALVVATNLLRELYRERIDPRAG